jgi:hypothetical protein
MRLRFFAAVILFASCGNAQAQVSTAQHTPATKKPTAATDASDKILILCPQAPDPQISKEASEPHQKHQPDSRLSIRKF